jgi:tRNA(Ile)-lysidine synthase
MPSSTPLRLSRENIQPGQRLAVAVSGGADSVALLLALHEANTAPRNSLGVGLSAVHVQHGIRDAEETAGDLAFVEELCIELDVPLHLHRADVPERARQNRETMEEAAREVRYEFFHTLIASGHADSVLTAHTLDDQAETVMMKLIRGAWTEGLSGIHPVVEVPGQRSGKILRPLLATSRIEVEEFLQSRGRYWRTDSTNADTTYTRNRVRHELMPLLRTFNPAIGHTLANLAELAREEDARWQSELTRLLPQILLPGRPVRGGGRSVATLPGNESISIEIERLRTLDDALRRRVIRAAARQLGYRLSFDDTARLMALAGFGSIPTVAARTGASVHLQGGLKAERSAREIRLHMTSVK